MKPASIKPVRCAIYTRVSTEHFRLRDKWPSDQGPETGTEFLDAETGRQKSQPKSVNAGRDQNPGSERPEIRAETRYLASCRKRAVCGDWMVGDAVGLEPVSGSEIPVLRPEQRNLVED